MSELVVFENVQTQPSRTHGPDGRRHPQILGCCVAPDVCVVVADKATAAVHRLGSLPSRRTHPLNQIEQRQVAFRQIADLCRPVVHLGVDVDGIAAAPSRPHILVPDALEIHGLCSRTAGGQHQISAVIEVQHCQLAVVDLELALLVVALVPTQPHEPFICGQLAAAFAVVRQGKAHPAELFLVFRQMAVQQFLIAAVCRIRGIHLCRILVLFPVVKACADAQQQGHFVRTLHFQRTAYSADGAAFGKSGQRRRKEDAVPAAGAAVIDQHIGIVGTRAAVVVVVVSAVQSGTQVHHAGFACGNMQHQHSIRLGDERLTDIGDIVCRKAYGRQSVFQI